MDERQRASALATVARNAKALARLPIDAARIGMISGEMFADPAYAGQNNERDAIRHSEWSRRMAEVNPQLARVAGDLVEFKGDLQAAAHRLNPFAKKGDGWEAKIQAMRAMDLHNNEVGRRAGVDGTPVDRRLLQTSPFGPRPRLDR